MTALIERDQGRKSRDRIDIVEISRYILSNDEGRVSEINSQYEIGSKTSKGSKHMKIYISSFSMRSRIIERIECVDSLVVMACGYILCEKDMMFPTSI